MTHHGGALWEPPSIVMGSEEGRRKTHRETNRSVSDRSLCGQRAASTHMSEHEREQWARGHGTMLDLERRGFGRASVSRDGLVVGRMDQSAAPPIEGGGCFWSHRVLVVVLGGIMFGFWRQMG